MGLRKRGSALFGLLVALLVGVLVAGNMLVAPKEALAASNTYTIKFAANGGAGKMANQSIARDKSVALRTNAYKRTAYVFTGWNTKKDGSGKAYKDKQSVKNLAAKGKTITLYAQWRKAKTYTVKFAANGGSGTMANQKITYNKATALTANAFTRSDDSFNYAFVSWNTKKDGSGRTYKNKASVTNLAAEGKTVTLYARWKATSYLVIYDANGGTGTMANQKITCGKLTKLATRTYTRVNYRFVGWNTAADGTGDDYDNKEVIIDDLAAAGKKVTLYAQWEPTTYELTFDANGGEGTMTSRNVTEGRVYRLPASTLTREGYAFAGWATEADGAGTWLEDRDFVVDDLAEAGSSVTLYAQWEAVEAAPEPATYTVAFDANGEGASGEMASLTVTEGASFRLAKNAFTREGFSFSGWNTAADGSGDSFRDREAVLAGELVPVDGLVTLYAQWEAVEAAPEPATYTIVFDANGGEGTTPSASATTASAIRLPDSSFTRKHYSLAGWNTTADGTGRNYSPGSLVVASDFDLAGGTVTLYAQWYIEEATLVYNPNGGTGEMPTQDVCGLFTTPKCDFTRAGYTCVGWNTRADGSGQWFFPYGDYEFTGSSLESPSDVVDGTLVLYAQWVHNQTVVHIDANGGTYDGEDLTLSNCSGEFWPQGFGFSRPGYMFVGLNTAADGSGKGYEGTVYFTDLAPFMNEDHAVTLYAQWVECYTIKYDMSSLEEGWSMGSTQVAITDTTTIRSAEWYHPTTWNTKADGTGVEIQPGQTYTYEDLAPYADENRVITLYAQRVGN